MMYYSRKQQAYPEKRNPSGIPKSSTLNALISMIHHWSQATDGSGAAVRIILVDYRKAFDLIDHNDLIQKVLAYGKWSL